MYPRFIGRKSEYSHIPGQIESQSALTQIGEKTRPTNRYAITASKGVINSVSGEAVDARGRIPTTTRAAMKSELAVWNARNPTKHSLNIVPPETRLTFILEGIG